MNLCIENTGSIKKLSLCVETKKQLSGVQFNSESCVFLNLKDQEGEWVWSYGNFSSEVSADTKQALYISSSIAPSSSGAWVRVVPGDYDIRWWGVSPQANGPANSAALQCAFDEVPLGKTLRDYKGGIYPLRSTVYRRKRFNFVGAGMQFTIFAGTFLPGDTTSSTIVFTKPAFEDERGSRFSDFTVQAASNGLNALHVMSGPGNDSFHRNVFERIALFGNQQNGGRGLVLEGLNYTFNAFMDMQIFPGMTLNKCADGNNFIRNSIFDSDLGGLPGIVVDLVFGGMTTTFEKCSVITRDGAVHIINGSMIKMDSLQIEQAAGTINQSAQDAHIYIEGRNYQSQGVEITSSHLGGGAARVANGIVLENACSTSISRTMFGPFGANDVVMMAPSTNNKFKEDNVVKQGSGKNKLDCFPFSILDNGTSNKIYTNC